MTPHACDETCVCPIHETPLIYAPSIDDHACQDIECVFGHGTKPRITGLAAMVAKMNEEDFAKMPRRATPHPRDPEVWPSEPFSEPGCSWCEDLGCASCLSTQETP